jgi:hypothetical protein
MTDPAPDPALVGDENSVDAATTSDAAAASSSVTPAGDAGAAGQAAPAAAAGPAAAATPPMAGYGPAGLAAVLDRIAAQAAANGSNLSSALAALSRIESKVAGISTLVEQLAAGISSTAATPMTSVAPAFGQTAAGAPTPVVEPVDAAPTEPELPTVMLGDVGEAVRQVAQLLERATGESNPVAAGTTAAVFTDHMAQLVADFQKAADVAAARVGAVCSETWHALEAAADKETAS